MHLSTDDQLTRLAAAIERSAPVDASPDGPENIAAACVLLDQMAGEHHGEPIGEVASLIANRLALTVDHEVRRRLYYEAVGTPSAT
jgi:hypothetical protein